MHLPRGGPARQGRHQCRLLPVSPGSGCALDNFVNAVRDPSGSSDYPESLVRVQKLTGKTCTFHEVDLLDKAAIGAVFSQYPQVQAVIHFAALKAVGESFKEVLRYYGNNITGACNLLEVMTEFNVKRIVFSSSATVYGPRVYLPLDEKHRIGECTNPYG